MPGPAGDGKLDCGGGGIIVLDEAALNPDCGGWPGSCWKKTPLFVPAPGDGGNGCGDCLCWSGCGGGTGIGTLLAFC